jgi:hypothetical protein
MNKFARNILIGEDGTLSTSKIAALLGFMLIVHIWVDLRYLHLEYDASVLAFWMEIILIALGLRGVDRFSRYGLSEVVGKVGIGKKKDEQLPEVRKKVDTPAKVDTPNKSAVKKNQPIGLQDGHFSLEEFDSHDGARMPANVRRNVLLLIEQLEVIRAELGGKPIEISSGYRSKAHNLAVNGKPKSYHLTGQAADIKVKGLKPSTVAKTIKKFMDEGKIIPGGLKAYDTFTHYDIRGEYMTW